MSNDEAYLREWREAREKEVLDRDGYLGVVGTYWLENDKPLTVGSDSSSDIVLEKSGVAANCGSIVQKGNRVFFHANPDASVRVNDDPLKNDTVELNLDSHQDKTVLKIDSFRIHIMDRDYEFGVRVKDVENPAFDSFTGLDFYPFNPDFRFDCKVIMQESPKEADLTDVHGSKRSYPTKAVFEFVYKSKTYRLISLEIPQYFRYEKGFHEMDVSVMFRDASDPNSFRYLFPRIKADSTAVLDFNLAVSPPCSFSPFVPCPMPHKENTLDFAVEAGEKYYNLKL